MTEQEAKEKSCCGPAPCGRLCVPGHPNSARRCIASACMAWRWEDECDEVATDIKCDICKGAGVVVTGSGENTGGEECNACVCGYQTEALQLGFCGLAGKP